MMSEDPIAAHRRIHQQRFDDFGEWDGLDATEQQIVARHGAWLQAMSNSELTPVTAQQHHFVAVSRGTARPENEIERAWVKYARNRDQFLTCERRRLVDLALADNLSSRQLEQVLANAKRFDFSPEEVAVLQAGLTKHMLASITGRWLACHQCGGDGGAGGRCPSCSGNGFGS
jgi:uncharacterized protein YifE (UPF0438 family)